MIEVNEHHVVAVFGHVVIERDRSQILCMGVTQALHAARPRSSQGWHLEDGAAWCVVQLHSFERRFFRQCETSFDGFENTIWRQVKIFPRLLEPIMKPRSAFLKLTLGHYKTPGLCGSDFGLSRVQFTPCALY